MTSPLPPAPPAPPLSASGRIDVPVAHGHLEALLKENPAPFAAAVVCHPHPLYGGTMNNNVVFRVAKALSDAGASVLRFNFRGVGASTGQYADGVGEEEDARAALDFMEQRHPGVPLWMAGFSFGARVGLTVGARDPRVKELLGIGLALKLFDFDFLTASPKPKAFVQASDDEFGGQIDVEALVQHMVEPKRLYIVNGATHLFPRYLDELEGAAQSAIEFLKQQR
jgi:alpha/beta superfamily hydrolase